jgi:hypothetical protein
VVATPGAIEEFRNARESLDSSALPIFPYLERHLSGDWGDLPPEDARENELSAMEGLRRILSSYTLPGGRKVWIITEADRSSITILLPEEY